MIPAEFFYLTKIKCLLYLERQLSRPEVAGQRKNADIT